MEPLYTYEEWIKLIEAWRDSLQEFAEQDCPFALICLPLIRVSLEVLSQGPGPGEDNLLSVSDFEEAFRVVLDCQVRDMREHLTEFVANVKKMEEDSMN